MKISNGLTVIRFLNIDINAILTLSQYVNDALIGKLTLLNRDLRGVLTKSPPIIESLSVFLKECHSEPQGPVFRIITKKGLEPEGCRKAQWNYAYRQQPIEWILQTISSRAKSHACGTCWS